MLPLRAARSRGAGVPGVLAYRSPIADIGAGQIEARAPTFPGPQVGAAVSRVCCLSRGSGRVRSDCAPWLLTLGGSEWVRANVSRAARAMTVTRATVAACAAGRAAAATTGTAAPSHARASRATSVGPRGTARATRTACSPSPEQLCLSMPPWRRAPARGRRAAWPWCGMVPSSRAYRHLACHVPLHRARSVRTADRLLRRAAGPATDTAAAKRQSGKAASVAGCGTSVAGGAGRAAAASVAGGAGGAAPTVTGTGAAAVAGRSAPTATGAAVAVWAAAASAVAAHAVAGAAAAAAAAASCGAAARRAASAAQPAGAAGRRTRHDGTAWRGAPARCFPAAVAHTPWDFVQGGRLFWSLHSYTWKLGQGVLPQHWVARL